MTNWPAPPRYKPPPPPPRVPHPLERSLSHPTDSLGSGLPLSDGEEVDLPLCPSCGSNRTAVQTWPKSLGQTWFAAGIGACVVCGVRFGIVFEE